MKAELHGRIGHFPALVRLHPKSGPLTTYEVAELLNLQTVRDEAWTRRRDEGRASFLCELPLLHRILLPLLLEICVSVILLSDALRQRASPRWTVSETKGVTFFEAESCPLSRECEAPFSPPRGMSQPDATSTTMLRRLCAEHEVKT